MTGIAGLLTLDLRVLHRNPRVEAFRVALGWTALWFSLACLFGVAVGRIWGMEDALQFATGYLVELSLSMDNVFVMALIFSYFAVPATNQHRVLFLGILGAMLLRALMIWAGVELVQRVVWMLEVFGAFLLLSGLRMVFCNHQKVHPEQNPVIKLARKLLPLSSDFAGQNFVTHATGRRLFTPLVLVLIAIETSDLVFALDSIPASFGVTQKPFLIFTSNVFAILGLRSLYFVLAGAIEFFRYLKTALALLLSFIGVKMLIARWLVFPTWVSLEVVAGVFTLAIAASVAASAFERRAKRLACTAKPSCVQELRENALRLPSCLSLKLCNLRKSHNQKSSTIAMAPWHGKCEEGLGCLRLNQQTREGSYDCYERNDNIALAAAWEWETKGFSQAANQTSEHRR